MSAFHTPGPWFAVNCGTADEPMYSVKAERISGRWRDRLYDAHEVCICATGDSTQEMEIANAILIATAPELLDALIKLSNEVLGSMPTAEPAMRREIGNTNYSLLIQRAEEARALIAKAGGRDTDAKFATLRAKSTPSDAMNISPRPIATPSDISSPERSRPLPTGNFERG